MPLPARSVKPSVLVLGLVALLSALTFPFAPVEQPDVTYSWSAADGPAAIPLMPYQPATLTAQVDCAAARGDSGRTLLSTVPAQPDAAAEPLAGLWITTGGAGLRITSAGLDVGAVPVPSGHCSVSLVTDPERTTVLIDGAPVLTRDGDLRPDVAGAFTDVPDGVSLTLTTDTRFQTTISPLKVVVAGVCVLALLGMVIALGRADRTVGRAVRLLPRRWWRPRLVDAAVTALLGVWWLIGPITVDDGYIAGIVRSRGSNGFVGNAYRWLNAPEAPFSWFYDVYHWWSLLSPSTTWMRLPSTLLGLLCWWLLSRAVLPRLGRFARRRSTPWLAALAFGTWWLPFNPALRPEPWAAVGALTVFVAVERAVASRRVVPLVVGLVVAGASTAVTPAGVLAFAPFLAAAVPVLRLLRERRDLHTLPLVVALLAAPMSAVLLMVRDQSLAAVLEAVRIRARIGGGMAWYEEFQRYATLLEPADFQGAIGRRAAVLITLLAAAGVLFTLRSVRAGIARGPARRLVLGLLLALAALTVSPTKWTQHFGDVAGYGAAVLVLGLVTFTAAPLRPTPRLLAIGLGISSGVSALVLAGTNAWPYASDWFGPSFDTVAPNVGGVPVATIVLVGGALVAAGLLGRSAWSRASGAPEPPVPQWIPAPAPVVAVVLALVVTLQVGSFVKLSVEHPDTFTLASDSLAVARGEPCGLQRMLSVETDPAAGLLPARPGPGTPAMRPVDVGGSTLPGIAVNGTFATAWFTLDPAQRGRAGDPLPVVLTTTGATRPGDTLDVEFAAGDRLLERRTLRVDAADARDTRLMAPAGADAVRLLVDAPTSGSRQHALVSLPRVPRLTPMTDVLPPGSTAILDWPVAFLFPCVTPQPLRLGTAGLARWRIAPPQADPSAGITYSPGFGGPFAAARLLITEQRMATYLRGDPLRDAASLHRWVPLARLAEPEPVIAGHSVAGGHSDGHARVPGLDAPG